MDDPRTPAQKSEERVLQHECWRHAIRFHASYSELMLAVAKRLSVSGDKKGAKYYSRRAKAAAQKSEEFAGMLIRSTGADPIQFDPRESFGTLVEFRQVTKQ